MAALRRGWQGVELAELRLKLSSLPSRIGTLDTRTKVVEVERLRGQRGVDRRARWLAQYPLCNHCEAEDRTTLATIVDHRIPLWEGGPDDESNFQSLCVKHHDAKTAGEATRRAGL